MIHHAGNQQCRQGIEHADLRGPLDGVRLSCGGSQSADAGHVKADGEDKGQSLRLGKVREPLNKQPSFVAERERSRFSLGSNNSVRK